MLLVDAIQKETKVSSPVDSLNLGCVCITYALVSLLFPEAIHVTGLLLLMILRPPLEAVVPSQDRCQDQGIPLHLLEAVGLGQGRCQYQGEAARGMFLFYRQVWISLYLLYDKFLLLGFFR